MCNHCPSIIISTYIFKVGLFEFSLVLLIWKQKRALLSRLELYTLWFCFFSSHFYEILILQLQKWKPSTPSSTTNTPNSRFFSEISRSISMGFLVFCVSGFDLTSLSFDFFIQKKKFSEFDEVNKEQEEKFLNFVSGTNVSFLVLQLFLLLWDWALPLFHTWSFNLIRIFTSVRFSVVRLDCNAHQFRIIQQWGFICLDYCLQKLKKFQVFEDFLSVSFFLSFAVCSLRGVDAAFEKWKQEFAGYSGEFEEWNDFNQACISIFLWHSYGALQW